MTKPPDAKILPIAESFRQAVEQSTAIPGRESLDPIPFRGSFEFE
jgi:hypothetical protein